MIAVVLVTNRKTGEKKTIEFWCTGYSDAMRTIKDMRKVSKSKMSLKELRSG